MTVSRVINGGRNVASVTATRVKHAMEDLDYAPQAVRPGPKTKKRQGVHTGAIAFISFNRNPRDLYEMAAWPALMYGIQQALNERGLEMVMSHSPEGTVVPPLLERNQVDGVLLFGDGKLKGRLLRKLTTIPAVWCFRSTTDRRYRFPHVFYDNSQIGAMAANYLIEKGHRQLAFISPWPEGLPFAQRREQFIRYAAEKGIQKTILEPQQTLPGETVPVLQELTRKLIRSTPRPTGLFCPSDGLMATVFHELRVHGIEPGHDIDLIGCNNDVRILEHMHPRPASIDIQVSKVGRSAVDRLIWQMAHPNEERNDQMLIQPVIVPCEKAAGKDNPLENEKPALRNELARGTEL